MNPPKVSQVDQRQRIIVTGYRHSYWIDVARRAVVSLGAKYHGLVIIHGGAMGIDKAFDDACRENHIPTDVFRADWDQFGRAAGPIRNQAMVDAEAIMCLAFHPTLPPKSGTADCVRRAIKAGIPTWWKWTQDPTIKPVRQFLPNLRDLREV